MENFLAQLAGLEHWQIDLLVIGLLIESVLLPIVPEEVILLTLGTLIFQGRVHPLEALLSHQVGVLTADFLIKWLGQLATQGLSRYAFFTKLLSHPVTVLTTSTIRKHAPTLIFLVRFTPTVRSPVYIGAGVARVSNRVFLLTDFLASLVHVPLMLSIGYGVAKNSSSPGEALRTLGGIFVALFLSGVGISLVLKKRAAKNPPIEPSL